jgi:flagellar biosynthetic protein FlhB
MADESTDQSQKTEEPTSKRLEEARKRGQVATSREVNHWFMILGGALVVAMAAPAAAVGLKRVLLPYIESPHVIPLDAGHLRDTMVDLLLGVGVAIGAPLLLLCVAALGATLVQGGVVFSLERITPTLDKISLFAGAKRLLSLKAIVEFAKGVLKITVVAAVATYLMMPEMASIDQLPQLDSGDTLELIRKLILKLFIGVVAVLTVITGVDLVYQKVSLLRQLRMSRQEVRDEMKQTEGDPMVRQRLRQIRQERARRRMMAAVPEASVVITNPTHFAVALKYEMGETAAPICLAKGMDSLAFRIREVAEEHDVPIVENPPVAQMLYANVEVDEEIKPEHYKAVAEIIGYILRLKGKLR